MITTGFHEDYNAIVDYYFPNFGFDLMDPIEAKEEDDEAIEDKEAAKNDGVKKSADKVVSKTTKKDSKSE